MIFLRLFYEFFKVGLFAVGGGMATFPFLEDLAVKTGWYTQLQLADMIAISESTPGPIGVNMATYVGFTVAGIPGSVIATIGLITPSVIVILIVARFYEKYKQSRIVKGCMSGLKPAVVGLIGAAILSVVAEVLFPAGLSVATFVSPDFYVSLGIFALTCTLAFWKKVHPIWLILLSAALGIGWGYLAPLL